MSEDFHGRVEDDPLITGRGLFADDLSTPGELYAVFARSPYAHARIISVNIEAAKASPGVVAVFTGADMAHLNSATTPAPLMGGKSLSALRWPKRPALASVKVAHIGEAIALIVAESRAAATDGAGLVEVDYDALPAVTDGRAALEAGAPELWADISGNLAAEWEAVDTEGNAARVKAIIAAAPHIVRRSYHNQRLAGVTMEPRGVTASFDAATGRYTYRGGSQGPAALQMSMAAVLGVAPDKVRILSDDVGGAFGLKTQAYPEYAALLVAAQKLGRPVHWIAGRSESFLSDNQGRDNSSDVTLALDKDGRFLALDVSAVCNIGAYASPVGAAVATRGFAACFPGMYDIPAVAVHMRVAYTNTVPTGPYRGAGRPEANYVMERVVDAAARELGLDRLELRRRNFIDPRAMPYRSALGNVYDSGDFEALTQLAAERAGLAGFHARRAMSEAEGRLRGIGMACFLEHSGGSADSVPLLLREDKVIARIGVQPSGQGHLTVYGGLLAQHLGLDLSQVRIERGDSDMRIKGGPAVGSRSTAVVGPALLKAADLAIEKGSRIAAAILQASDADVSYAAGFFSVAGSARRVSLFEVARSAAELAAADASLPASLDSLGEADGARTFPNGCHIAEIEIDPGTGKVEIVAYTARDDSGRIVNHMLAEGQIAGGIAQGIGQALLEEVRYDSDGQLLSGSFMDYGMPRAENFPDIVSEFHVVPATTNRLGAKGIGESGTTAATAAVMNAIVDAIPGAPDIDMPATPERVWQALQRAR